jgi:hypothetical protein
MEEILRWIIELLRFMWFNKYDLIRKIVRFIYLNFIKKSYRPYYYYDKLGKNSGEKGIRDLLESYMLKIRRFIWLQKPRFIYRLLLLIYLKILK